MNFMWKLSYRKDDHAMRPIRGCPEKFRDSLTTRTATIPKIFHGLLFRSTLWMFLQNLKSVAIPVPEIIGGYPKNLGSPWIRPRSLFSKFLWAFIWIAPINVPAKFEVRSFTRSRDNAGYPKYFIWTVPRYAHAPFSPKFLTGIYSELLCKYIPKFEVCSFTCSWDKRG